MERHRPWEFKWWSQVPQQTEFNIKPKHRQMRSSVGQLWDDFHLDSYFITVRRYNMRSIPLLYLKTFILWQFHTCVYVLVILILLSLWSSSHSFVLCWLPSLSHLFILFLCSAWFNQSQSAQHGAWSTSTGYIIEGKDFLSSGRTQLPLVMKWFMWDSYW